MRGERHRKNAEELEFSARELIRTDPERHIRLAIEGVFGAAHHYIAYGLDRRHGVHSDRHEGVSAMLRRFGHEQVAKCFEDIDSLRHGRFYGGRGDGKVAEQLLRILEEIKRWAL